MLFRHFADQGFAMGPTKCMVQPILETMKVVFQNTGGQIVE